MFYKNNWMTWYYDGVEKGTKTKPDSKYELRFTPTIKEPVKSYKEELLANTRLLRDSFSEPFDLMFSGGVDSEVILRCNIELGIPINVFIFRYENNYNLPDVTHALRICDELNVTPTVIDFNLEKFFENEAYDIWKLGYFSSPGRLPHMKMFSYLDNIPIMGDGNPDWIYNRQWLYEFFEQGHGATCYANTIGRTAIADWYECSPEVILSHSQTPLIQKLIAGGPVDYDQYKYLLHNSIWPEIVVRPKLVGYECLDYHNNPLQVPGFMREFRKQYIEPLKMKFVSYKLTPDEFISKLCVPAN